MKKIIILIIVSCFLFFSCKRDVKNLNIHGVIKDKVTRLPIKDIKYGLKIECWSYGNSSYGDGYDDVEKRTFTTDSEGEFSLHFDKGAFIGIILDVEGYEKLVEQHYIRRSENEYNIELIPAVP